MKEMAMEGRRYMLLLVEGKMIRWVDGTVYK